MNNIVCSSRNVNNEKIGFEYALEYAALGLYVLPVHTPVVPIDATAAVRCSCRDGESCSSKGKHPRTLHGFKDATREVAKIKEWWSDWPDANIGIATGRESGVFIIDVDSEEGEAYLTDLQKEHGPLFYTWQVATGRGRHIYFRHPAADVEKHAAYKKFEGPGIGQIFDADESSQDHTGQRPDDGDPGEGPGHAALTDVTIHPTGNSDDIENEIRGAHRRAHEPEHAHLQREKQEGSGDSSHRGEGRDDKGDQGWDKGIDVNAGHWKVHAFRSVLTAPKSRKPTYAESFLIAWRAFECDEVNTPMPGMCFVMRNLNSESASRNLHISSGLWRWMPPGWHNLW
jgi:hypothetical protein